MFLPSLSAFCKGLILTCLLSAPIISKPVFHKHHGIVTKRATPEKIGAADLQANAKKPGNVKVEPVDPAFSLTLTQESLTTPDGQQLLAFPIERDVLLHHLMGISVEFANQTLYPGGSAVRYTSNYTSWTFTIASNSPVPIPFAVSTGVVETFLKRVSAIPDTTKLTASLIGAINNGTNIIGYALWLPGLAYAELANSTLVGHEFGQNNDQVPDQNANVTVLTAADGGSGVVNQTVKTSSDWLSTVAQGGQMSSDKTIEASLGTAAWKMSLGLWKNDDNNLVSAPVNRTTWVAYGAALRGWYTSLIANETTVDVEPTPVDGTVTTWFNYHNIAARLTWRIQDNGPDNAVGQNGEALTALANALWHTMEKFPQESIGYAMAGSFSVGQQSGPQNDIDIGTWDLAFFPILSEEANAAINGAGGPRNQVGLPERIDYTGRFVGRVDGTGEMVTPAATVGTGNEAGGP